MATGRNDPCPCGSGKKYKKCCLPGAEEENRRRVMAEREALAKARRRLILQTDGKGGMWNPHMSRVSA